VPVSTDAILFYGITSQDDADSPAEVCRRLDLITDEEAFEKEGGSYEETLKDYLKPKGLDFGIHGSNSAGIVYIFPLDEKEEANRYCIVSVRGYFNEIDSLKLGNLAKILSPKIIKAMNEIAQELGYWAPSWKLVSYWEV